jgi:sulfur carrier protein ThiS
MASINLLDTAASAESKQLPAGVTLEDVLRQLGTQSQSNAAQTNNFQSPSEDQVNEILNKSFDKSELTSSNSNFNRHAFRCILCNDLVILPNAAEYVEKPIEIHPYLSGANTGNRVTINDHWQINDKMSFENISVTRPINEGSASSHKYLACSACDKGPIGITYLDQPNVFYINHGRVRYSEK